MNGHSRRVVFAALVLTVANTWMTSSHAGEPTAPEASAAPPTDVPPAPNPGPDAAIVTRAKERKLEGDRAMDSLRYADALTAYNESYALIPESALLYNLGRTLEALDRLPEALEKLELFRSSAPPELLAKVPGLKERISGIQKRISQLTIRVNVEGARILVRDAVAGKSPLEKPITLKAGKASVLIEADGYFPYQINVELPGGGGYVLDAQLSSKEKFGRIAVRAPKTNVSVSLDGRSLGQAPIETLATPGTHKIMARHPEHSDYATTVIVKAGEERAVMVTLGDPPVYKRWWFWPTVGAVVVGGTVATIVAVSERAPDRGDIAPFQLTPSFYAVSPVIHF
jgi:PEGA domain